MDLFTQTEINNWVSIDMIGSIIAFIVFVIYFGYKIIDYLWFCHKLNRHSKKEKSFLSD